MNWQLPDYFLPRVHSDKETITLHADDLVKDAH